VAHRAINLFMSARRLWCLPFSLCILVGLAGNGLAGNSFSVTAPAFAQGKPIPPQYAYAKQNKSPELRITGVPANARSLALIVDDPDSPSGLWTHWLVWNLPVAAALIPEEKLSSEARVGKNSFGDVRYDGPAPPAGTHRYFFRLYALDTTLSLPTGSARAALEKAMEGHIVGIATTFGTYQAGQ
jgi:Raf kinase inhibitor-like YbhB/YbcL family protein